MARKILFSTPAQKQFKALDNKTKKRVRDALNKLSKKKDRKRLDIKKLRGIKGREDLFRLRVGKYRIIFQEEKREIKITNIIPRSRGYDWL